ncbi:MAG: site-specific integrase, partial [Bifidobacterium crudilactis]|nr:site-specific integrase [Bifidobacterium crudilactis]
DQVELRGLHIRLRQSGEVGEFYRDVVQVLSSSGIRWGEARSLRVEDVLLEGVYPRFHIRHSNSDGYTEKSPKSGKGRYVPISPEILGIVEKYMQDRSKEDYLLSRDGTAQLNASNFRRDTEWKQISGGHTIHDFRHSAAVNWIQAGVPITTIKAWLGHANIQTTMRYLEYLGMDVDVSAYQRLSAGQLQDKTENKEGEKAKTENEE